MLDFLVDPLWALFHHHRDVSGDGTVPPPVEEPIPVPTPGPVPAPDPAPAEPKAEEATPVEASDAPEEGGSVAPEKEENA